MINIALSTIYNLVCDVQADYHESSVGHPLARNALPCIAVPCGRQALSAIEGRKTFAQRLAAHRGAS